MDFVAQMHRGQTVKLPHMHSHLQNTCAVTPKLVCGTSLGVGEEYLHLHFSLCGGDAALTHNAPAGPVLKVVCNLFLRCTLVL